MDVQKERTFGTGYWEGQGLAATTDIGNRSILDISALWILLFKKGWMFWGGWCERMRWSSCFCEVR